jgi:hypothetical protein
MRNITAAALFFLAFSACNNNNDKSQALKPQQLSEPIKIELPNTPESVVRTWEEKINKNDFTIVRLLSMGSTLDFVNSLAESDVIEHSDNVNSEIVSIQCTEKGNNAQCDCILKDESGKTAFKYELVRNNGQWMLNDVSPKEDQSTAEPAKKKPTNTL